MDLVQDADPRACLGDIQRHPTRLATIMATILLAVAAACDVDQDAAQILNSQVRDSAGITIVENARPASGSRLGWRIGETPAVSIGTEEGDPGEMLFDVRDATRLGDGRIVVANAGTSDLRVFAAGGTYLETWGRQGEGPGEFSAYTPEAVSHWPGDSIAADNMFGRRVEVFDSQGSPGRTVTLADGYHSFLGVLPDGTVLAKPSAERLRPSGVISPSWPRPTTTSCAPTRAMVRS